MTASLIQSRIYAGSALAAAHIGQSFDLYRPTGALNPISLPNKLLTLQAAFDADGRFDRPIPYGGALWQATIDGRLTQIGDYLIGGVASFFIAAMQSMLPILAVKCNRVITVTRPGAAASVGAVGYSGDIAASERALMTAWPASVLAETKTDRSEANLPGDIKDPWWAILLPALTGLTLRSGDIVTDDLGRRYAVSGAELSAFGWRLSVMQAET